MRFLVTGTGGFIGFHAARLLLQGGHAVVGFDGFIPYYDLRLKKGRHAELEAYPQFTPFVGKLENKEDVENAMQVATPDVIIHLAAQAGVRYSLENPQSYLQSNIVGTWNILEASRRFAVTHLLLASTSSVYGGSENTPYVEAEKSDEPLTFYAASKKSCEVMAYSYSHLYGIPTTVLRFFTVYGPWGRPDMALFKFTEAICNDAAIDVYGDGKMLRDFTYIDDVVASIDRLIPLPPGEQNRVPENLAEDTLSRRAPYRVVNIGGGSPVELMEFVSILEDVIGKRATIRFLPVQTGEMVQTHADYRLLEALTGFKPRTPFRDGARAFVQWYVKDWARLVAQSGVN